MGRFIAIVGMAMVLSFSAKAEIFKGYPDAIVCDFSRGQFVAYIHGVLKDGTATYFALNGEAANINSKGILERKGASCDGKSVEEMRNEGKAFDLRVNP